MTSRQREAGRKRLDNRVPASFASNEVPLHKVFPVKLVQEEYTPTTVGSSRNIGMMTVTEFIKMYPFTVLRSSEFVNRYFSGLSPSDILYGLQNYCSQQRDMLVKNALLFLKSIDSATSLDKVVECISSACVRINHLLFRFAVDDQAGLLKTVSVMGVHVPDMMLGRIYRPFASGECVLGGVQYWVDYNSLSVPHDLIAPPGTPAPDGYIRYKHISKPGGTVAAHDRYSYVTGRTRVSGYMRQIPSWIAQVAVAHLTKKRICDRLIYPPSLLRNVPREHQWVISVIRRDLVTSVSEYESVDDMLKLREDTVLRCIDSDDRYIAVPAQYYQIVEQLTPAELDEYFLAV